MRLENILNIIMKCFVFELFIYYIIRIIESWKMTWEGHILCMDKVRNLRNSGRSKWKGKGDLGRLEDNCHEAAYTTITLYLVIFITPLFMGYLTTLSVTDTIGPIDKIFNE